MLMSSFTEYRAKVACVKILWIYKCKNETVKVLDKGRKPGCLNSYEHSEKYGCIKSESVLRKRNARFDEKKRWHRYGYCILDI